MINPKQIDSEMRNRELLIAREYGELVRRYDGGMIEHLPDEERTAYILGLAGLGRSLEAELFLRKFSIQDPEIQSRVSYLVGDFESTLRTAQDPYLRADALIALGKSDLAIEAIQNCPVSGTWYYYMGRCFAHRYQYDRAIIAHQHAAKLFLSEGFRLLSTLAQVNLANSLSLAGRLTDADRAYRRVADAVRNLKWKEYPEFGMKILTNAGNYFQNRGDWKRGSRMIIRAYRIAKSAPQSNSYVRVACVYGNLMNELGYYERAIEVLQPLQPKKSLYRFDRARYLVNARIRLGDLNGAARDLEEAQRHFDESDSFATGYFPSDRLEYLFHAEGPESARRFYEESLSSLIQREDEAPAYYLRGLWAHLTHDQALAKECLDYHLKNKSYQEAERDYITLARAELIGKNPDGALEVSERLRSIRKDPSRRLAIEMNLIQGVAHLVKGNAAFQESLLSVLLLTQNESWHPARWLAAKVMGQNATNASEFREYFDQLNSLPDGSGHFLNTALLHTWKDELDPQHQVIDASGNRSSITRWALKQERFLSNHLILNLERLELWTRNECKPFGHFPVLARFLKHLADRHESGSSKEDISRTVFERREYHPLTDDNTIYVSVNRINRMLHGKSLVEAFEGRYRILKSPSLRVVLPS